MYKSMHHPDELNCPWLCWCNSAREKSFNWCHHFHHIGPIRAHIYVLSSSDFDFLQCCSSHHPCCFIDWISWVNQGTLWSLPMGVQALRSNHVQWPLHFLTLLGGKKLDGITNHTVCQANLQKTIQESISIYKFPRVDLLNWPHLCGRQTPLSLKLSW